MSAHTSKNMSSQIYLDKRPRLYLGKRKVETLQTSELSLLEMQLNSYREFLQEGVAPNERTDVGLHGAFKSIFPIISYSGDMALQYVNYSLGEPLFDVAECKLRGLTYAAPLKVTIQLVMYEKDNNTKEPIVKDIKEQEVYMGDMPLMTETGSFVINGTERVVVSQLHRSPGVFFEHDKGKTHSSGKVLFSARVIPYRGSWLDFEFDAKDYVYFRIDRRRKMPVTILLRALGYSNEDMLRTFFEFDTFHLGKKGIQFEVVAERLRGDVARFDIAGKSGKIIVAKDKRITVRHIREMQEAGIDKLAVTEEFLIGRV